MHYLSRKRQKAHMDCRQRRIKRLVELGWAELEPDKWMSPLPSHRIYSLSTAIDLEQIRGRLMDGRKSYRL